MPFALQSTCESNIVAYSENAKRLMISQFSFNFSKILFLLSANNSITPALLFYIANLLVKKSNSKCMQINFFS